MNRRTFIQRAIGAACWLLDWSKHAAHASGNAAVLTILHTNDIHGHLTAWQGWEGNLKGKTIGGLSGRSITSDMT